MTAPPLYTAPEVAALFGVHGRTVATWARQGLWGAFRTLGGHWRFRAAAVDAARESAAAVGVVHPPVAYERVGVYLGRLPGGDRWHIVEDPAAARPLSRCALAPVDPTDITLVEDVPEERCCRRPGCRRIWDAPARRR